jgi:hypothetical protein
MASKDSANEELAENGVPHSVIAQAEAAIIGELEDETPLERRRSRAQKVDYSQYQPVQQKDGKT